MERYLQGIKGSHRTEMFINVWDNNYHVERNLCMTNYFRKRIAPRGDGKQIIPGYEHDKVMFNISIILTKRPHKCDGKGMTGDSGQQNAIAMFCFIQNTIFSMLHPK